MREMSLYLWRLLCGSPNNEEECSNPPRAPPSIFVNDVATRGTGGPPCFSRPVSMSRDQVSPNACESSEEKLCLGSVPATVSR